ncbi:MAG: amino acid adenylation domain-containing protein [Streptosporangiaceae bacterium]
MPQDLISELRRRGVRLRLVDDRLDVLAPPGALTAELREDLRLRRDWLAEMLRRNEAGQSLQMIQPHPEHRYEPFPLTDMQHAYWVGRQSAVELGGVSTHFYLELERTGLDLARLAWSLRQVIDRHDMLRAVITPDGQQRILPEVPGYEIAVADLRSLPEQRQLDELARIKEEMGHQVRPADQWPLFEIRASQLAAGRLRLHVSLDLLIMDAFSLYLLFNEWRQWYEAPDWAPAPLQLSYRDYVLAEVALRDGAGYRDAERYWLGRLDELPPGPALPLAVAPAEIRQGRFTRRAAGLPAMRWDRIKRAARQRGLTPSAVLLTAFADVLRRWANQPDLTLSLTLFNRPQLHPDIAQLIGDFTSVTLLAARAEPRDRFVDRAQRLQQQLMEDLANAAFGGVRVLRERSRRLGGGPAAAMPVVFTSALALQSGQDPAAGMAFFGEFVDGISQTPQVWLDHQVSELAGDLAFNWDAVEALFPAGLLDDMFDGYRTLIQRLGERDDAWEEPAPLPELPDWQAQERRAANDTAAELPVGTLGGLIEARAAEQPNAVAVVDDDGQLRYGELAARGRQLARRLTELGAAPNTLVAVVLEKGRQQVAAVLSVCLSGAAYLPIDAQWPQARRWELMGQGGVRLAVTTARLRDELRWPPGVRVVAVEDPDVSAAADGPLPVAPSPDDLAYVIFTSGSTGQPKGVMIDHRGAVNTIADINQRFRIGPDDSVMALSALSFDLSVYDIFGLLAAGGRVVMPSPRAEHDPAHWTELVRRHRVTVWNSVPALMQAWLESGGPAADGPASPADGLRLVLLSGDWIAVSLPDAIRACYPHAQVISLGGATEASIWSVCYPIGELPPQWTRIPYGKPLANQTLQVCDAQLRPCPVWTVGEIYIGGTGVAKGYWADPDRTAERFLSHPETGERRYRTGDLGRYLPGGDIEFLGRADFQVKINGYRIELGEIAATLRRLPGVSGALATVGANPKTGRRQLIAYVVPGGEHEEPDRDAGPEAGPESGGKDWEALVGAGESVRRRHAPELAGELASYRDAWRAMERLCLPVMARTLARLGVFSTPEDTATAAQIVPRCGLRPRYSGLLDQWLTALADAGVLATAGQPGAYRAAAAALDLDALDRQVERERAALDALRPPGAGPHRVLIDYVLSCVEHQVELLTGQLSPLELLLPGGDWRVTDVLYASNPVSRLQNLIAAQVVGRFADTSPSRPVRILEVGAGTGGTTAQVLPALPAGQVSYDFTDVSTFFTERARRSFASYPFVHYGVLDIDRDLASQGYPPGSADVVIGANVLHDAKDLQRSLGYLRSTLAPGGLLLLIEGTANSLLQLLTVGFIEGFSSYQGHRQLPLLSAEQWRKQLTAAGFGRFAAVPDGDAVADVMTQQVLLAEAPAPASGPVRLDPAALREQLAGLLPDYLVPQHYLLLDRLPLNSNGKVDRAALPEPWDWTESDERIAPQTDLERQLLGIWREALSRDDIGVEDNFFELGGDSLHALRILSRLRDELGLRESADEGLQILFGSPTIAELARELSEREGA